MAQVIDSISYLALKGRGVGSLDPVHPCLVPDRRETVHTRYGTYRKTPKQEWQKYAFMKSNCSADDNKEGTVSASPGFESVVFRTYLTFHLRSGLYQTINNLVQIRLPILIKMWRNLATNIFPLPVFYLQEICQIRIRNWIQIWSIRKTDEKLRRIPVTYRFVRIEFSL